jgi:hypothetical protein
MAIEYTWTIAQLERNTSDGGVTVVHWRVAAVDGATTLHQPTAQWVAHPIPKLPIGLHLMR